MTGDLYAKLGVDATKGSVRKAFSRHIDNDFPGAWVNIIRDTRHPGEVVTQHMDGDGSKILQRLLMSVENGELSVIAGMVDDGVGMNTGDVAAAGFVGWQTWTDVLNLNAFHIPKDAIMSVVGARFAELRALYRRYGIEVFFLGGETAELPHQVQTAVFDVAIHASVMEADLVKGHIRPWDLIWGFASDGQAVWESGPNSGIMSNGLTLGRTELMDTGYTSKYPHLILPGIEYGGRLMVGDRKESLGTMTVGEALISPTRQ